MDREDEVQPEQVEQTEPADDTTAELTDTAQAVADAAAAASETEVATEFPVQGGEEGDGGREATAANETDASWRKHWEEAGFHLSEEDSLESIARRTREAHEQQRRQIEQLGSQVKFYQDQTSAPPASKQASPQASGGSSDDPVSEGDPLEDLISGWEDPRWVNQYIETDESGFRKIKDGVDEMTRERVMEVDRKLRQWGEVIENPQVLFGAIERRVEKMVEQQLNSGLEQRETSRAEADAINEFTSKNADWLYQRDPISGDIMRDYSGYEVYSEKGMQFLSMMEEAEKEGISSRGGQINYAQKMMRLAELSQSAAPVERREETADAVQQQRQRMRGRKNTQTSTQKEVNGVSPTTTVEPTGEDTLSFGEIAFEAMKTGA